MSLRAGGSLRNIVWQTEIMLRSDRRVFVRDARHDNRESSGAESLSETRRHQVTEARRAAEEQGSRGDSVQITLTQ